MFDFVARALLVLAVCAALPACQRCKDGGRTYRDGDTWTCADGCNHCACHDGDTISTRKACGAAPSSASAGMRDCDGPDGRAMPHASTWSCDADTCCTCDDGVVERAAGACADP